MRIGLKNKMLGLFLAAGLIPILLIGFMATMISTDSLMEASYGQLVSMRGVKKGQIETFFAERKGDMGVLVETVGTCVAKPWINWWLFAKSRNLPLSDISAPSKARCSPFPKTE